MGNIPQVFIVALYVPWCRRLEAMPVSSPSNMRTTSSAVLKAPGPFLVRLGLLLNMSGRSSGCLSPGKLVLLSTSKAVRKSMKLWNISGDGMPWKVELNVRDLGGHLDFTRGARAGTLSCGVWEATHGVAAVGAILLGFQVKQDLIRGKHLPAGLHAVEASCVSASSPSAFRAAIVRAAWSCKMLLATTPATLTLLDGPDGVDPAYYIVRARFRMTRRYLAHRPDEVLRIFHMLDLLAHDAEGHGPAHLLLTTEIGFA